jgi:uncharacterized protein YbgA (DUF1722 family)/uncharacterized protein YbbK (DUF523 family)
MDPDEIRVGVSACLVGRQVRFDGQHKRDGYVVDVLGQHLTLVPVCPEVEVGMGIPRDTLRLVRDGALLRMVAPRTGRDYTAEMTRWSAARARGLEEMRLSGYVLKKDSPSCGLERVKVYAGAEPDAAPVGRTGVGLFAGELARRFPSLPIEEEGRLNDAGLRESFVERVFAYHRVQALFDAGKTAGRWTVGQLVAFHTAHKLTLLAHAPAAYRSLGRLVATGKSMPRAELRARYVADFMAALKKPATPGRHENVLLHMMGYFKTNIDTAARDELLALIADFRAGRAPLVAPLTLLRHHARRLHVDYLLGQIYLTPDPRELVLRNRA